jgi:hypothetical protein
MSRRTLTALLLLAIPTFAWIAWQAAAPEIVIPQPQTTTPSQRPTLQAKPVTKPNGWVPPEGDPVVRYQAAKTPAERKEIIGSFMALGHANNHNMLITALNDPDPSVRFAAVEYAASLTPEEGAEVYRKAAWSDDSEVREMAWSLAAPHPMETKVRIYGEALEKGGNKAMEETLAEMGRSPERPLFELMLSQAVTLKDAPRVERLVKELQSWLQPGGGNVPTFKTAAEVGTWWTQESKHYDQYMLRVDQ